MLSIKTAKLIRNQLVNIIQLIDIAIKQEEEGGCLHENSVSMSTMGSKTQKFYCNDCDERYEVGVENEEPETLGRRRA